MPGFTICKRSIIEVKFPSGGTIECDPIVMNDEMDALRKQHGEADYVEALAEHLASCIVYGVDDAPVPPDHSQALDFNDHIVGIVTDLQEARKKKVASTVSSLCSIQESPATTEDGTKTPSKLGSTVTVTQSDDEFNLTEPLMT